MACASGCKLLSFCGGSPTAPHDRLVVRQVERHLLPATGRVAGAGARSTSVTSRASHEGSSARTAAAAATPGSPCSAPPGRDGQHSGSPAGGLSTSGRSPRRVHQVEAAAGHPAPPRRDPLGDLITRWSGQSLVTVGGRDLPDRLHPRAYRAGVDRISGVPGGTSAAASTCAGVTRCVPVTVTDRTTSSRVPSSAQARPATKRDAGQREERGPPRVRGLARLAAGRGRAAAARPARRRTRRRRPGARGDRGRGLVMRPHRSSRERPAREHQRAEPGDIPRAHGQYQVTRPGDAATTRGTRRRQGT